MYDFSEQLATVKKKNDELEQITKDEFLWRAKEAKRCHDDIVYFANKYFRIISPDVNEGRGGLGVIKTYPKQEELLRFFQKNNRVVTLAARQSGKSTSYNIFCLWRLCFFESTNIMLLAQREKTAIELLGRLRMAYEYLPDFLKPSIVTYNKSSIEFAKHSKIEAFATASQGARGTSANCVTGDTLVTIVDDYENIFHCPIEKVTWINANFSKKSKYIIVDESTFMSNISENKKYYYVYKTVNDVNNKEYIGFHSTDDLEDGYLGSGKLLLQAIEKYGIEHFHKTILYMFDNKKDAEDCERKLVNKEYVERRDTYNLSIGGNVCILFGENNGFYGKHHTKASIEKIKEKNKEFYEQNGSPLIGINTFETDDVIINGIRYNSFSDACNKLNLCKNKVQHLLLLENNGYVDKEKQKIFVDFMTYKELERDEARQHHLYAIRIATKNPERNKKISMAHKGRKHPWQDKINKNPEKIKKMAEKHKGMKRSIEARENMSASQRRYFENHSAQNKGKIWIHNIVTKEKRYISKSETIPTGWALGMGGRK
jgi:hypothetical protein